MSDSRDGTVEAPGPSALRNISPIPQPEGLIVAISWEYDDATMDLGYFGIFGSP